MRVLHASHNHHIVGGSDAVFFQTSALLEKSGHQVVPFCVASKRNEPSPWSSYFPVGADLSSMRVRDGLRYFHNREAARNLNQLLGDIGSADIAHMHIYHGKLTPAILPVFGRRGIPVVQSLHEYKLACPVYTLQRDGANCVKCVDGSVLNAVRHRCKDGSLIRSAVMAAESVVSRIAGDVRLIDRFICVSEFQRDIMERAGLPRDKLMVLHNFIDLSGYEMQQGHDGYVLYFGRIEELKGLDTLLRAAKRVGCKVLIAGNGSWSATLQRRILNMENVTYLGFQRGDALRQLIANSAAVAVPSLWYENCPMSVLEAKALGRPILGARVGGIPELVRDGIDGHLFEPDDDVALAKGMEHVLGLGRQAFNTMSQAARQDVEDRFSADTYLSGLMDVYHQAMNARANYAGMSTKIPSVSTVAARPR